MNKLKTITEFAAVLAIYAMLCVMALGTAFVIGAFILFFVRVFT